MRMGARLLFGAAILVTAAGLLQVLFTLASMSSFQRPHEWSGIIASMLYTFFKSGAFLLLGAMLVDRADRIIEKLSA